jgi:hypothetical protein
LSSVSRKFRRSGSAVNSKLSFEHIEDTKRFQESLPYHPETMSKGKRFEIYLQALRVIDKEIFLREAELLYIALEAMCSGPGSALRRRRRRRRNYPPAVARARAVWSGC